MMYTAKQVAEMLQVGVDVVKCFVDSGELDAIDVSLVQVLARRSRVILDDWALRGERALWCGY